MQAFTHILHPSDFSDVSRVAWQKAMELAQQCAAKLTLIHVYADPTLVEGGVVLPDPAPELRKALDEWALSEATVPVERELLVGVPSEIIVQFAKQRECDLIVMGTHGRSGLSHLIMGSVAESVVRRAHCSVLVVRSASE